MGSFNSAPSSGKYSIVVCGLDNSGKSAMLNMIKPPEERMEVISATVGYKVERFKLNSVRFTAFDMGGSQKFRDLWKTYYELVNGVVFVVDSSDVLRLCVVKDELDMLLKHLNTETTRSVPLLVYANKMDLNGAKNPAELVQLLDLYSTEKIGSRPFNIFASNALKGTGVNEGMTWLQDTILKQKRESSHKNKKK